MREIFRYVTHLVILSSYGCYFYQSLHTCSEIKLNLHYFSNAHLTCSSHDIASESDILPYIKFDYLLVYIHVLSKVM